MRIMKLVTAQPVFKVVVVVLTLLSCLGFMVRIRMKK